MLTMGETMKHKWGIAIAMGMVAITMLACGGGGGNDATVTPTATVSPERQKQMIMDNAFALGETVFYYDAEQIAQFGLFSGGERIVYIKSRIIRTVKLTSNECLNLEIRSRNDAGDWDYEYGFTSVSPGDYVYFETGLWRVTRYNPANAIATGG